VSSGSCGGLKRVAQKKRVAKIICVCFIVRPRAFCNIVTSGCEDCLVKSVLIKY